MAVQARTLREDNASSLFVYALGVESLGKNGAPAAVNDLTVTPDAVGELEAVVAFTLPEASMGGETLTEPVTANIYRDDVAVATLDNQTAGSQVEWTDNSVEEVGVHTYTVAAQNADGEGKRISASAFIGVYEPPYVNSFDEETADDFFVTVNDSVGGNPCKWEWSSYNTNLALGNYVQKELERRLRSLLQRQLFVGLPLWRPYHTEDGCPWQW